MHRVARRQAALQDVVTSRLLDDDYPLIGMIDKDAVIEQVQALQTAFAGDHEAFHMVAAKAVTLLPVLQLLADLGLGCEVASPGELAMALRAGFSPSDIVYDSPAKTTAELVEVFRRGVNLNVDNAQELRRVDELVASTGIASSIGLRINPQRGSGSIEAMSTASSTSKFGFPLMDDGGRETIVQHYLDRPWMTQIHVHSGSQGLTLEQMAQGVSDVSTLAEEIDRRAGHQQITRIDIGGGLPVNFDGDDIRPTYADYRKVLESQVPGLFDGRRTILTEFGRSLMAKTGTMVTRVEYAKTSGGRPIAVTHAGAQVATRTVLAPHDWPVRATVHEPNGHQRVEDPVVQDLAGPCCFAGDVIARERLLPRAYPGDLVALHETGAYYMSSHYSYNALPRPAIYFYRVDDAGTVNWEAVRRRQSVEDLMSESGAEFLRQAQPQNI